MREIVRRMNRGIEIPSIYHPTYHDGYDDTEIFDEALEPNFDLTDAFRLKEEFDTNRNAIKETWKLIGIKNAELIKRKREDSENFSKPAHHQNNNDDEKGRRTKKEET